MYKNSNTLALTIIISSEFIKYVMFLKTTYHIQLNHSAPQLC